MHNTSYVTAKIRETLRQFENQAQLGRARDEMANNTNTQVYVGFLFPTRETRINCPKIDGNEAILINLQFVLRARHNFVVNSSCTKTITFHLRKTTRLMFFA